MPKKRQNAEEIIHKLREADVLLGQGRTVPPWGGFLLFPLNLTEFLLSDIGENPA